MSEEGRPISFSFSRFGRRLDQQKHSAQRNFANRSPSPSPERQSRTSQEKRDSKTEDWLFKRVDRSAPVPRIGDIIKPNTKVVRDYNPHFQVIEKHIPKIEFSKQTKRRSMSLQVNMHEPGASIVMLPKAKLIIPFELQPARKIEIRKALDNFYLTRCENKNNAHSFESYSARKPLVQKDAMPDYDIVTSFTKTQKRQFKALDFGKMTRTVEKNAITALLDYEVITKARIRGFHFDKQVSRDQFNKTSLFRKIFSKVNSRATK